MVTLIPAYDGGPGSIALPWLCFATFLTGIGGAAAFSGSIKTCKVAGTSLHVSVLTTSAALNWPNHRGTATAFPLSAFGLGAFFFTTVLFIAFPDNTSDYLILCSAGTFGLCYCSISFLQVVPHTSSYSAVPTDERRESNPLNRTKSKDSHYSAGHHSEEPGTLPDNARSSSSHNSGSNSDLKDLDETSSLISKASSSSPGDIPSQNVKTATGHDSRQVDIRNIAMLPHVQFWQLWLLLGLLTGIGLMTIK